MRVIRIQRIGTAALKQAQLRFFARSFLNTSDEYRAIDRLRSRPEELFRALEEMEVKPRDILRFFTLIHKYSESEVKTCFFALDWENGENIPMEEYEKMRDMCKFDDEKPKSK